MSEEELLKQFEKSYKIFFNNLVGTSRQKNSLGMEYSGGWKAYTTNYDLVFETYWKQFCPIDDFFDSKDSGYAYFDSNKSIQSNQSLIKLHGSLNWWKLDNNLILKSDTRPVISNKKVLALLYPIQQKDIVSSPWLTLLQQLKKDLLTREKWYVVGYGFNDDSIKNIFLESFTSTKKLFLINPNANEIMMDKFPKHLHDKIILLPIKFGEDDFENNFIDFNRQKRLIQIKIETQAKKFLIDLPKRSRLVKILTSKNVHNNPTNISTNNESFTLGWQDQLESKKEVEFELEIPLKFDTKFFEFNIGLNSNTPVKITIYLREKLVDVFSISSLSGDSSWGPGELIQIPFHKFFN